jgi:predicted ArsR family transcriptional regulator
MAPTEDIPSRAEVDLFIIDYIDSVPHLEALLLLWQNRSQNWTVENAAKRLWIDPDHTKSILQDLTRNQFLSLTAGEPEKYSYRPDTGNDRILRGVAHVYRQEMIRISTMIHAKPSSAVRAFARAFRFTKEQE